MTVLFMWIHLLLTILFALEEFTTSHDCLPDDFHFLEDTMESLPDDEKILQDIRYYTPHNFMGRRVEGYNYPGCILQDKANQALLAVQKEALQIQGKDPWI